jgi:hypothetical protein
LPLVGHGMLRWWVTRSRGGRIGPGARIVNHAHTWLMQKGRPPIYGKFDNRIVWLTFSTEKVFFDFSYMF